MRSGSQARVYLLVHTFASFYTVNPNSSLPHPRAKVVQFTEPYFDANQDILVKKGTKVSSLEEAKGLKWGAQLNTTGAAYIADTIKPATEARLFDRTVVTPSSGSSLGCIARARTIATRCCWPPERLSG
jgi:hypothetical protein